LHDWQINIGGKPNFALYQNLPAFIPVTFESTVLCAAHLMFWTYAFRSKLLPGVVAATPDPRVTDNKFAMQVWATDQTEGEIQTILKETGASEIR
jgi:hypothetical protein